MRIAQLIAIAGFALAASFAAHADEAAPTDGKDPSQAVHSPAKTDLTRDQVRAEYIKGRKKAAAIHSEDSGSEYLTREQAQQSKKH